MTIGSTLRTLAAAGACASLLSACIVAPVRPPRPAPVAEVIPPPPAAGYRWVEGRYRWKHGGWVWVPGHWRPVR